MKIFIKTTLHSFTIWVLAALLNAILTASCLSVTQNEFNKWGEAFGLALFFTLVFSIPALFIFWIIYITSTAEEGNLLFRTLLSSAFITAFISAIIFYICLHSMFKGCTFFLALSILIAAVTSIMFHHRFIVNNCKSKIP